MAETIQQQVPQAQPQKQAASVPPIQQVQPNQTPPQMQPSPDENDLIKRLVTTPNMPPPLQNMHDAPQVNVQMDDLKDPNSRRIIEERLKEANAKISKTFGEIGSEKAKLLKEIEELKSKANPSWTPQRLQEELKRQDFIQSAQSLQAQVAPQGWEGSHEEWSALSDYDKQRFHSVIANQQMLQQQMNQMLMSQVDAQLRTKYPDYDSDKINSFIRDAQEGRVPHDQIREFVHKAMNADRWARQSYELGKQDRQAEIQEKVNGSTNMGLNATLSDDKPVRGQNENSRSYLSRLMNWNLAKVKTQAANQRV